MTPGGSCALSLASAFVVVMVSLLGTPNTWCATRPRAHVTTRHHARMSACVGGLQRTLDSHALSSLDNDVIPGQWGVDSTWYSESCQAAPSGPPIARRRSRPKGRHERKRVANGNPDHPCRPRHDRF